MSNPNLSCNQLNNNKVFNNKFILPNRMNNFPAGWQIGRGEGNARFSWLRGYRCNFALAISNYWYDQYSSICQDSAYYIPVNAEEEWKAGAILQANQRMKASIIVNMISSNGEISYTELLFMLQPGYHHYYQMITIPENIQFVWLEIGTNELGVLQIHQVFFTKINKGKACMVEAVNRIIEPVKVERKIRNTTEDFIATTEQQASEIQNVFYLRTYTYSVINLGTTRALIKMQCSPDGINFMDEPPEEIIEPNEIKALTCNHFLPFVRVCFRTEAGETPLRIFLNGYD